MIDFIRKNFVIAPMVIKPIILQIPMADAFRAEGKIYVVLGVMLVLLIGFFYYLLRVDTKVKKIEKELEEKIKK